MEKDCLEGLKNIPDFETCILNEEYKYTLDILEVMQINLGSLCNLSCKHCHVGAGPQRKEIMNKSVMQACLDVYKKNSFKTIDITGGSPEMNPNFEWFIDQAVKLSERVIVRSNLVILLESGYEHLFETYANNKIELACSLPYYRAKDADRQRGSGVFESSIKAIKRLNDLGYGKNPDLILNLVYNPGGAFFPPDQAAMEKEYKTKLGEDFGITFNNLFTITNNPNGRFKDFLCRSGNLESYMEKLYKAFNASTLETMMCRNQLSVAWDGQLYDCDFNQVSELSVMTKKTIMNISEKDLNNRRIVFGKHCFACTAGKGSSCGGTTEV